MRLHPIVSSWCILAAAACGGAVAPAGADASGSVDAGSGDAIDAASDDAWTACSAPGGIAICGGSATACSANVTSKSCYCEGLTQDYMYGRPIPPDELSVCDGPGSELRMRMCPDGQLMVAVTSSTIDGDLQNPNVAETFECEPVDVGILYSRSGWQRAVVYADYSVYTGEALPTPSTCPPVSGITFCGGPCGGCPDGSVCTGRSPLHPYSFCVPDLHGDQVASTGSKNNVACGPGLGCFAFTVQPSMQAVAEANTYCIPTDLCQAATKLPGGGECDSSGSLGNGWTDCFVH